MTAPELDRAATAATFGAWVSEKARAAGYQIDGMRSGGKKALANATGMSHASVSRLLAGQVSPDPRHFEALAKALGVPLHDLLVEGGIVSRETMQSIQARTAVQHATEDVARLAGITTDAGARMLAGAIELIQAFESPAPGSTG